MNNFDHCTIVSKSYDLEQDYWVIQGLDNNSEPFGMVLDKVNAIIFYDDRYAKVQPDSINWQDFGIGDVLPDGRHPSHLDD